MHSRCYLGGLAVVAAIMTACGSKPPELAIIDAPNDYQVTAVDPVQVEVLADGSSVTRHLELAAGTGLQVLVDERGRLILRAAGSDSLLAEGVEHFSVRNQIGRDWVITFVREPPGAGTEPLIRIFPAP